MSIFATFVGAAVTEVEVRITSSTSKIAICTILKILSAMLTIMIFSINGTVNDYFVAILFCASTNLGKNFFQATQNTLMERPGYDVLDKENKVDSVKLDSLNLKIYLNKVIWTVNKAQI